MHPGHSRSLASCAATPIQYRHMRIELPRLLPFAERFDRFFAGKIPGPQQVMGRRVFGIRANGGFQRPLVIDGVREYICSRESGGFEIVLRARFPELLAAIPAKVDNEGVVLGKDLAWFALIRLRLRILA